MQVSVELARTGARGRLPDRRRAAAATRPAPSERVPRRRRRAQRARRRMGILEPDPRRGASGNARPVAQRARQRLAALPDLACRMWARSGFYQSGGAFGFRDQLQDVMALVHAEPGAPPRAPAPCAGRQFARGRRAALVASAGGARRAHAHSRTTTSGCRYATCRYVFATGDTGVLDERRPSSRAGPSSPTRSPTTICRSARASPASLYEHCVRAMRHGLPVRRTRLPLMGCGDWNDGMNLVGDGKGESVVAGVLPVRRAAEFPAWRARGDMAFALNTTSKRDAAANIETARLGRRWYRRAYFDNGDAAGFGDEPRMSDRFAAAELGGPVGGRRSRACASGDGRRGRAPGPSRGQADPAARSAVRPLGPDPG